MPNRILAAWAIIASLLAAGATGFAFGRQTPNNASTPEVAAAQPHGVGATDVASARSQYVVPETLRGIDNEWRSRVGRSPTGYAALFNPERRQLIIERCAHHGYPLESAAAAQTQDCEQLAKGRITTLEDARVTLRGVSGQPVDVPLSLDAQADPPVLRLALDGHDLELIPGSRQDLFQAFEALPDIKRQKQTYLGAMMAAAAGAPAPATRR